MSILLAVPVAARVVQVLKDFLYTRTQALDTALNDGIATPQIPDSNFYDYDRRLIMPYPACSIETVQSEPIVTQPSAVGQRVDAWHRLRVKFHLTVRQGGDLRTMEKLAQRYVAGAVDVLAVLKDGLETVADPVRWGSPTASTVIRWADAATYGPEVNQEDGSIVRTAILPIDVRRTEPH